MTIPDPTSAGIASVTALSFLVATGNLTVEQITDEIRSGCDTIEDKTREIVANAPGYIDAALDNARVGWPVGVPLPGPVKSALRAAAMAAVNEVAGTIYDTLDVFRAIANMAGRPTALRAAATTLNDKVATPGDSLETAMTTSKIKADDSANWQSKATPHYTDALVDQKTPAGRIGETARGLSNALNTLADDIEGFFKSIAQIFVSLALAVVGLIVAIATFETGVGAIVGIAITVAGLGFSIWQAVDLFTNKVGSDSVSELHNLPAIDWPTPAFTQ